MHDKLKKLLQSEEHEPMHPMEKHARESILQDLRDQAHEMLGNKLKGLKKVSVMSDSPEGLKHGLDKAEEMVSEAEHKEHSQKPAPEGEDLNKPGNLENPPDLDQDAEEDYKEEKEEQGLEHEMHPDANDYGAESADGEEYPEHKGLSKEEIEKRIAHLESMRDKGPGKHSSY